MVAAISGCGSGALLAPTREQDPPTSSTESRSPSHLTQGSRGLGTTLSLLPGPLEVKVDASSQTPGGGTPATAQQGCSAVCTGLHSAHRLSSEHRSL